jgi:hypothetical protein
MLERVVNSELLAEIKVINLPMLEEITNFHLAGTVERQ